MIVELSVPGTIFSKVCLFRKSSDFFLYETV